MQGTHWSLGVVVGGPILALIVAGLIVAGSGFRREQQRDRWDDDGTWAFAKWGCWIAAGVVIFCAAAGYFPYQAEYHQWRPVEGTVQQVSSRLLKDGDNGISQRYVFLIDGQAYGVDDTRAALVRKGDRVRLSCKREWQWFSVPGWGCRWNGA